MTPEMFAEWREENLFRPLVAQPTDPATPATAGTTVPVAQGSTMIGRIWRLIRRAEEMTPPQPTRATSQLIIPLLEPAQHRALLEIIADWTQRHRVRP